MDFGSSAIDPFDALRQNAPVNLTKTCFRMLPQMINSRGFSEDIESPANFLKYSLPLLELQVAIICIVYQALYLILKRFGTTMFVTQLLTGIILGPTFLGRYDFVRQVIFPHDSQEIICTLALLGLQIFLFLGAVKLDTGMILRTGRVVMVSGVGVVMAPLILGLGMLALNINDLAKNGILGEAVLVVIMQCFTTLSIIAHVLNELKLVNSGIGRLALSSALIGDLLGLCILSIASAVVENALTNFLAAFVGIIFYVLVAVFIFRPAILWVIRNTPEGSPVNSFYIYTILILVIASEIYLKSFHQVVCIGPIVLGLCIPSGPPLGSALVEKLETVIVGLFVPLNVVTSVFRANLRLIFVSNKIKFYLLLVILSVGAKFIACFIPALYWKMPLADSLVFSVIMTSRGIIELTAYLLTRDILLISEDVFAFLVLCLISNSVLVEIIVKYLYDPSKKYAGYQTRDIMSLKPKSELRILACIRTPENVTSTIGLLDSFHPHKERPIGVYVLHLINLVGRANPVFISHEKRKPISNSRSHNVILSFTQYQQKHWNTVSVSTFSAISPSKLMDEDICLLALDKLASIILLPLHRKWNIHGSIETEDHSLRTVNCRVLERAPCSVGLFFDRGKLGRQSSTASPLFICMIFLGGADDREALSLAKRAVKDSNANLTVIHLIPENDKKMESEDKKIELDDNIIEVDDKLVDAWALEDIKQSVTSNEFASNVIYREQVVKDGPQVLSIIRSIVDEYDFFWLGDAMA
ncbi:hypothetical protein GH714_015170 [Hevea brasiliensis]|uniref:Uncharacterized protein n=1 Tax=Hevea brasiliensis TaxID=3981 RepID=A0A6A6LK77_HEVBR|nr:hypothetical protein GH714_015170 [Hevea brasiliensis]